MKDPKGISYILIIFLVLLILTIPNFDSKNLASEILIKGKAKVTDGDTIKVKGKKIRFSGIDSHESYYRGKKQACYLNEIKILCGDIAKTKLKEKIKNNSVSCKIEKNKDVYNRFLGECFLNGESLSKFMVRNGYAFDWPRYSKGKFAKNQEHAKINKLGFWNMKFEYPWEWKEKIRKNK